MVDVIILGAGGTGREIAEMFDEVFDVSYRLKGFLSDYDTGIESIGTIKDYPILEGDRFIPAIGDVDGRTKVIDSIRSRGGKFINFIHPMAKIMRSAKIGEGVIIFPFAYIGANADIGDFCFINLHAACGHDVKLGRYTELAPYSAIGGGSIIGEQCLFALHSVVAPKTVLGDKVVISQGSTIQKNQPDDSLIVGVPGKPFRKIGKIKI